MTGLEPALALAAISLILMMSARMLCATNLRRVVVEPGRRGTHR